jgi:hypothetical protein
MRAFEERDYARAVERLRRWLDGIPAHDPQLAELAFTALARVAPFIEGGRAAELRAAAAALAERIRPFAPRAREKAQLAL